jgi:uncharacterized membrane protein
MQLPEEQRLRLTIDLSVPAWGEYSVLDKAFTIALVGSIFVTIGSLAYVVLTPPSGEAYSEFYVLGPGGKTSGYPTDLAVNKTGHVIVGVVNHEGATAAYTVQVDLVGVRVVYNTTLGFNQTVEINRTFLTSNRTIVASGANWTYPYDFSVAHVGLWKVQFLLFKDASVASPYRELHFYVRVR